MHSIRFLLSLKSISGWYFTNPINTLCFRELLDGERLFPVAGTRSDRAGEAEACENLRDSNLENRRLGGQGLCNGSPRMREKGAGSTMSTRAPGIHEGRRPSPPSSSSAAAASAPHVDASRPSLGFPLGTALLLIIIFSLSGIFSCCYHWDKLRSLRRSFTRVESEVSGK